MRVFVTGGTGLIGSRLIPRLRDRSNDVVVLTRRPAVAQAKLPPGCTLVEGDPTHPGPWMDALADCDAVVHLAGENIFAKRWNEEFKTLLHDSRVKGTEHVVAALTRKPTTATGQPKVLVNGSAIGYYGDRGDEELTEDSAPGTDFLAKICIDWENAARRAESSGVRVVMIRIGVVLDTAGGPFVEMMRPFRMFAGGKVGSGQQWMSWIHHADIVGIILLALDGAATGPINGTAAEPVRNVQFAKALGAAMHRPSFFPTPRFALKLALGEVATVITCSERVLPKRARELGYTFRFPTLQAALADLLPTV